MRLHIDSISDSTTKFTLVDDDSHSAWADLFAAWRDPTFAAQFSTTLANLPYKAFRWECPGLTTADVMNPCEFVVVDDPSLDRPANQSVFEKHFTGEPTATFTNLGRDAVLVIPANEHPGTNYTHFASFLRTAPAEQHHALWASVAAALEERLSEQVVYLSTAGGGVPWLHVRLDNRPKYYAHQPYRNS